MQTYEVLARGRWPRALATLLVAALLVTGCGDRHDEKSSKAKDAEAKDASRGAEGKLTLTPIEAEAAGLKVEELRESDISEAVVLTANIQPNLDRLAHVAPRVPSRIVSVGANLGDVVKQGQVLARLDSVELGEAHSAYLKARTEASLAEKNLARIEPLYADQIVPQKDYLRIRAERDIAASTVRAAADRLRMLGVNPERLGTNSAVSVFPLLSPFSGTITEKHAILGELAQPDKSLFTVADLSSLWIEADVFEKDLSKIKVGSRAAVTVTAYPSETFPGRVAYISSSVNKETRTLRARIEVPNASRKLKPEMFATATVDVPATRRGLFVPPEAAVLMQGQPTLFVERGGIFEPRPVELGEKLQDRMQIKSGVKVGEQVVVSGAYALKAKLLKSQIGDSH